MQWFFKTDYRSFFLLNATQFLGALNDNIFKLLVIYLLIALKGPSSAPAVLSLAGAVFVIPFLLFSSGAGVLADRLSKQRIIVFTKAVEVVVMLFGLGAVYFRSEWGSYSALFCLAMQGAIFGPSKYGIIPELVESKMVSKANGSITSLTYLAIILGTFLASFLTDVTNKNFVFVGCVCVLIAVVGFFTSLGIKRTPPQNSLKRINILFFYEIYNTLRFTLKFRHLLPAIFGSAFFLFIGAFTQLNIIPFAMQSLHLSEVGGGYLFLLTAVGIAIGSILAGQISKDRVEPGISCVSGIFLAILLLLIHLFGTCLFVVLPLLVLLGMFGGAFLIPFDAFIQIHSPDEKRGQVIAALNFLSFCGVLLASFCLYGISEELGFTASSGFAFMGFFMLVATLFLSGRFSSFFLPFLARKILKRICMPKAIQPLPDPSTILIFANGSWRELLLFFAILPKLKIILPDCAVRRFPWFNGWIESVRFLSPQQIIQDKEQETFLCLFLRKKESDKFLQSYEDAFAAKEKKFLFVHVVKEPHAKREMTFYFSTEK